MNNQTNLFRIFLAVILLGSVTAWAGLNYDSGSKPIEVVVGQTEKDAVWTRSYIKDSKHYHAFSSSASVSHPTLFDNASAVLSTSCYQGKHNKTELHTNLIPRLIHSRFRGEEVSVSFDGLEEKQYFIQYVSPGIYSLSVNLSQQLAKHNQMKLSVSSNKYNFILTWSLKGSSKAIKAIHASCATQEKQRIAEEKRQQELADRVQKDAAQPRPKPKTENRYAKIDRMMKAACAGLILEKFASSIESVKVCNVNIFSSDVYRVIFRSKYNGDIGIRECYYADGYVMAPSPLAGSKC